MRLTVVGCAGSFAGPQSPASSYLISADDGARTWNVLLDLSNGALGSLQRHLDPTELDAVVLTHLHPDHCADLTGLYVTRKYRPGGSPAGRLPIHGPRGTAERIALMYHGLEDGTMEAHFDFRLVTEGATWQIGPLALTAYTMNHPVEAYGYRVTDGTTTLAFSGDTDTCDNLTPLLTGADLVLLDSAFVEGRDHVRGIHLTGRRAAQAAVAAGGVGRLMLTHIPAWNDPEECRAEAAEIWSGDVELATCGAQFVFGV